MGPEFIEDTAGMSGLCSAMSETSDQRLKGRRAGIFESWRMYFLVGSHMVTRWYGRAGSSFGCNEYPHDIASVFPESCLSIGLKKLH